MLSLKYNLDTGKCTYYNCTPQWVFPNCAKLCNQCPDQKPLFWSAPVPLLVTNSLPHPNQNFFWILIPWINFASFVLGINEIMHSFSLSFLGSFAWHDACEIHWCFCMLNVTHSFPLQYNIPVCECITIYLSMLLLIVINF